MITDRTDDASEQLETKLGNCLQLAREIQTTLEAGSHYFCLLGHASYGAYANTFAQDPTYLSFRQLANDMISWSENRKFSMEKLIIQLEEIIKQLETQKAPGSNITSQIVH